jgi:GxxExxY protein
MLLRFLSSLRGSFSMRKAGMQEGAGRTTMGLEFECLTGEIIGAAIEVHKELGPGFVESVYENALVLELKKRGIVHEQQLEVPIRYHGMVVGTHILDLFIAGRIVVELKSIKNLDDVHFAIVRSYLRAVRQEHGLLLNFAKLTLETRRVLARTPERCGLSPGFLPSL